MLEHCSFLSTFFLSLSKYILDLSLGARTGWIVRTMSCIASYVVTQAESTTSEEHRRGAQYLGLFVDVFSHAERLAALFPLPHAPALGVQVLLDALPLLLGDVVVGDQVAVDAVNLRGGQTSSEAGSTQYGGENIVARQLVRS